MKAQWPRIELDHLTEGDRQITYGVVKPGDEVEEGVKFVRGGDVFQGRIALNQLRTISPQLSQIYKRTILRGGELLISLVGNPGEVAIVPPSLEGGNIARQVGLIALRPNVDARFVMYFLMSPNGRAELFTFTGGAVQQVINLSDLKRVKIPTPPLSQQRRIATILSAYDDLIENNLKRIALLEEAARQLYKEWFIRLRFPGHEHTRIVDGVPEGWDKKKLGEVLTLNYGKSLKQEDRLEGEYPVYGSSGVVGTHAGFLVKAPGIIVGRKGNVGSVFWSHKDFYPIDTVYYIESSQCSFFLYHNLLSRSFMNSDGAVPGLNRSYAYSQQIVTPSKTISAQFEETVTSTHEQIFKLQAMNEKLKQARDLLLPRLMSGEILV